MAEKARMKIQKRGVREKSHVTIGLRDRTERERQRFKMLAGRHMFSELTGEGIRGNGIRYRQSSSQLFSFH